MKNLKIQAAIYFVVIGILAVVVFQKIIEVRDKAIALREAARQEVKK